MMQGYIKEQQRNYIQEVLGYSEEDCNKMSVLDITKLITENKEDYLQYIGRY